MKNRLIVSALLFLGFVFLAFFFSDQKGATQALEFSAHSERGGLKQQTIVIGRATFTVEVAETREAQATGLSGRTGLGKDSGMLFPFSPPQNVSFWMKDMQFPLDLVWIANGKVVGVTKNVPAPEPGTQISDLPNYTPPEPVDYVLELNAHSSEAFAVGDSVTIADLLAT
jgi:uncharacterized membrane protein (UPF0127 family)